jgi:hypothetical protein
MRLPPLKTDPKYGYFPWWPEDGNDWVHPEDIDLARSMIPSGRIFRRDGMSGSYHILHYGDTHLRVHSKLWQEVQHEGFDLGDWIEVLSRGLRNEQRTGIIREMLWDDDVRAIHYYISENNVPINEPYTRDDIRHVQPTEPLNARNL